VYEFIQKVVLNNSLGFQSIGLHAVLLIFYLMLQGKWRSEKISFITIILWSVGQLLLAFIMPYASLFGYLMAPWFLIMVSVLFIVLLIYEKRKVS